MSGAAEPLRIVADDAIAFLDEAFGDFGPIVRRPGRDIDRDVLSDADVLLVRSVTRVDAALLADTPVRFVGSATAGRDHVDEPGLARAGVTFAAAPGCNAVAVAEYVLAALARVADREGSPWPAAGPVGIVGFGCVGRRLAARLRSLGAQVLVSDPPLSEHRVAPLEPDPILAAAVVTEDLRTLDELIDRCDVLSLHVPLTDDGAHPTKGLLDRHRLARIRDGATVINTCRGGVVDDEALFEHVTSGRLSAVLDVWADEPTPRTALVDAVAVATPHVAGYSTPGKRRASAQVHAALARFAGRAPWFPETDPEAPRRSLSPPDRARLSAWIADAVGLGPAIAALRELSGEGARIDGARFEAARRGYALRDELSSWTLDTPSPDPWWPALGVRPRPDR